jgi:hypothetical protein
MSQSSAKSKARTTDDERGRRGLDGYDRPLAPDVYNYQFRVDGIVAMDPQNPSVKLGFGAFPPANLVEVPDDGLPSRYVRDLYA